MRNPALLIAIGAPVLIAAAAPPKRQTLSEAEIAHARNVLRGCGPAEAPLAEISDADWSRRPSVDPAHRTLREALGEPMPTARTMVSLYGVGGHLATTQYSIVLTRGTDGSWKGTAVGQSTIWVQGAKPSALPRQAWTVSAERGRRLDAILADKCYYAEPAGYPDPPPSLGSIWVDLETQTPRHQRRASFLAGSAKGLTKELADLSFPPPGK